MKRPSDQAKLLFLGLLRTATALATGDAGGKSAVLSQTALFSAAAQTLPRRHQQPHHHHHIAYGVQQQHTQEPVTIANSGVTAVQLRLAKLSDVPSVSDCNLQTLPENYNHVFYQHHLQEWPDLALVAVVDNSNNSNSNHGSSTSSISSMRNHPQQQYSKHQQHWHQHFGGGGSGLDENHINNNNDDCTVVAYLLGKIQERPKEVVRNDDDNDNNGSSSQYSLLGGTRRDLTTGNSATIAVERYGHVSSLAVLPDYRRQGLAQLLLQQFHHHLVPQQCGFAGLHVRRSNAAAVQLYQRLGYEPALTIPAYYEDGEDAYYMKKMLPSSVVASSSSSTAASSSSYHPHGGSTSQSQSFLESLTARLRPPPVRVWESGPEELRLPRTVQVQLPTTEEQQEQEQHSCSELLTGTY